MPLREAPREWVKGPRQLQKQVVLGGEPCKEQSKWISEEQSSKDSIVGELSVFVLFCFFVGNHISRNLHMGQCISFVNNG